MRNRRIFRLAAWNARGEVAMLAGLTGGVKAARPERRADAARQKNSYSRRPIRVLTGAPAFTPYTTPTLHSSSLRPPG